MAKKRFQPKNRKFSYQHFVLQKIYMQKHFPCFQCTLKKGVMICSGTIVPSDHCDEYSIALSFRHGGVPKVRIKNPQIEPSPKIHMYTDGALCLYDYREEPWTNKDNIHETIIPWTAEWLVFYEIYKDTGVWLGPEAPHGDNPKSPQEKTA